jgi:transcription initiation factor IIE alpha subunit
MSDSKEIIKVAAGIAIVLLVVLLGFGIYRTFASKTEKITGDAATLLDSVDTMVYTEKDGTTVTGTTVLSFITEREAYDDEICIMVCTKANTSGQAYVYDASRSRIADTTESTNKKNAKTKANANYINPNGKFEVSLDKDTNGTIQKITFNQQ